MALQHKIRVQKDGVIIPAGSMVGLDEAQSYRFPDAIERVSKTPPVFKTANDIRLRKGDIIWIDALPKDKSCFEELWTDRAYGVPDPQQVRLTEEAINREARRQSNLSESTQSNANARG